MLKIASFVHRRPRVLVEEAERLVVDQLALARHRHHRARQAAFFDVGAQRLADAREALEDIPTLSGFARGSGSAAKTQQKEL